MPLQLLQVVVRSRHDSRREERIRGTSRMLPMLSRWRWVWSVSFALLWCSGMAFRADAWSYAMPPPRSRRATCASCETMFMLASLATSRRRSGSSELGSSRRARLLRPSSRCSCNRHKCRRRCRRLVLLERTLRVTMAKLRQRCAHF